MPTDEQVWKMLDAWYNLIGRRIAPSQEERNRDFLSMKRSIEMFETEHRDDEQSEDHDMPPAVDTSVRTERAPTECPLNRDGRHRWSIRPGLPAKCDSCGAKLTMDETVALVASI